MDQVVFGVEVEVARCRDRDDFFAVRVAAAGFEGYEGSVGHGWIVMVCLKAVRGGTGLFD